MSQPTQAIPIEHDSMIYEIETRAADSDASLTLLELVQAVNEVSETEQELVATVVYMIQSGRIQLAGNFRGARVEEFLD